MILFKNLNPFLNLEKTLPCLCFLHQRNADKQNDNERKNVGDGIRKNISSFQGTILKGNGIFKPKILSIRYRFP